MASLAAGIDEGKFALWYLGSASSGYFWPREGGEGDLVVSALSWVDFADNGHPHGHLLRAEDQINRTRLKNQS